ncbi:heme ABC transporter ATP-binding protein [Pseudoalteromonas fenneropenaei]|uniref:Heme ABC transporter ATP-binding protein n=1 Tax=Pseudoalteromonas fenneropenaei TaxID=1737459 RepID=A0ABV7CJE4_9GAMM
MLSCHALHVKHGHRAILADINFELAAGQFIAILGENGAGKSTLLQALTQDIDYQGTVSFAGQDLAACNPAQLATRRAVMLQHSRPNFAFSAKALIAMGRYPITESEREREANVNEVIALLDLTALAERDITALSGGELQRVQFARCFAQLNGQRRDSSGKLMLLDEPTAALDLHHQHKVLGLAKQFARQGNVVVAVLHDLNLASLYADQVLLLADGRLQQHGAPSDVLCQQVLKPIYHTEMHINPHPVYHIPMIFSEPLKGVRHA